MEPEAGAPAGIGIRQSSRSDLPAIRAMMQEFDEYLNTLDDPEAIDPAVYARIDALAFGQKPRCSILLAEEAGGAAAGYLTWYMGVFMDPVAAVLYVADLYVRPTHRGAGLGRALMEAARGIAAAEGADSLMWTVWRKNPNAIAFYEHLGAKPHDSEMLMHWPLAP